MSSGYFKQTKSKIILSYILLFALSFIAVVFIYKEVTRLTVGEEGVSEANQKLFIIGNTIAELYEAETLSNVFLQTGSNNSFRKYIGNMEQVEKNIDSLRHLTTQEDQQLRLDSISMLLGRKTKNLEALIRARKSLTSNEFYDKAIASIELSRDSIEQKAEVRQRVITTRDSSYIVNERKRRGFLGLFNSRGKQDSTLQVTISKQTILDTLDKITSLQSTDTVVNILKSVWEEVQTKRENIVRQINRTEYNIIRQSTHITDQLRRILGEYEKEEINNSFRKIIQREQVVNTTTNIIAWIAVAASLIIVFFSFFILRDISRSQRYRRKLEAANQYAEQLLESREKLILTVTHDIKSPLGSIIGYIELLDNTEVTNRQSYFLKNMKGSSEHILNLVTNLLDLSKLESNKMPLEEVVFNPAHLFQEVCDSFMPLADTKKLRLTCKIGKDLDSDCKGDALRIRQVLSNILSNAVKYTNKGTIYFSAVTATTDDKIILKIKDSGPGMTQEEQEMIFREFTRLSSASTIEGTGLGLTITLKLVELLNGEIALESAPGEGSCFTIQLPLKRIKQVETPATAPQRLIPAKEERQLSQNVSNLRILLVDDDPLQLEMTSALLQTRGIAADTTTYPDKILEHLQSQKYDVVFSDIQMPGTDGFALVQLIRQSGFPGAATIPVVALSANPDKTEAEYQQAGFTAYLNKPFTSVQLFEVLEKVSGRTLQTPAPTETNVQEDLATNGYTLKNIMLFTDNDPEATRKIVESFIHDTHQNIDLFKGYLQTDNYTAIFQLAHKMLPMFRQLEASPIVELLQKLERSKETGPEVKATVEEVIRLSLELNEKLATR